MGFVLGHFSDIHMQYRNVETDLLRVNLLSFLKEKNIKFDAIVISGDVAYKGIVSDDLFPFIERLCDITSCQKENIHICCGNHDIPHTEGHNNNIRHYYTQRKKGKTTPESDVFDSLFLVGQRYFLDIYQKITGTSHPLKPHYVIETDAYNIFMINTCLLSGSSNNKIYVTDMKLSELLSQSKTDDKKLNIAVGHHGIDYIAEDDQVKFRQLLDTLGVDLYLSGHSHRLDCETFDLTNNKIRQVTAGGLISDNYTDISFSVVNMKDVQCTTLQYYTYACGTWQEKPGCKVDFCFPRLSVASKVSDLSFVQSVPAAPVCEGTISPSRTDVTELDKIPNLFALSDMPLAYFPIIASWKKNENEYRYGDITVVLEEGIPYKVPDEFKESFEGWHQFERDVLENTTPEPKVRLNNYKVNMLPNRSELTLFFSKTIYSDFLLTSNRLDYPIKPGDTQTFRELYFSDTSSLIKPQLSCICGVGVFIISKDDKIIVRQSSANVTVAPLEYSYSASGTMDWKESLHPFDEIQRECQEEIGHNLNTHDVFMFSFGMDYKQAYFQFSFYEISSLPASKIIKNAIQAKDFKKEIKELIALDFTIPVVINFIRNNKCEQAAAAALITLLTKKYSKEEVEAYINPHLQEEEKRNSMISKWNERASRKGNAAVFSSRIPFHEIDNVAEKFVGEALAFIGDDLQGSSVLEVGCGIGLMTKQFAKLAHSVCCVDLSEQMIERNKNYLGTELLPKVEYYHCFMQDFQKTGPYDLLVCAQMLIHNKDDKELKAITDKMKLVSKTIFLFEQLDTGIQVSTQTRARSFEDYVSYFPEYRVVKKDINRYIFTDQYAFIKLVRVF
jgi:predicted phosphodiesterase/SAM-dependent methyltransferase